MSFNDTFYAVVEAGSINNGRRRNVSFDQDNNEITVNNAFEPANDWSVDLSTTPYGAPRSSMCGNSTSFDDVAPRQNIVPMKMLEMPLAPVPAG